MKKSCNNCAEYIVCYGMDEVEEDKGEICKDWRIDYSDFEELYLHKSQNKE